MLGTVVVQGTLEAEARDGERLGCGGACILMKDALLPTLMRTAERTLSSISARRALRVLPQANSSVIAAEIA
jgi:formyltetrahydrofolate synthetase